MGTIRLILALSVVAAHAGPILGLNFVGGEVAVQLFFIISGFYMAVILNEKYIGFGSYKLFITNRLLKLFPSYWFILALSLLTPIIMALLIGSEPYSALMRYKEYETDLDSSSFIVLLLSNLFILGQDVIMFLKLNSEGLFSFTSNFMDTNPRVYNFLFIPQAWSLSIELMFYLIAPFIVRNKAWKLVVLIVGSLLLRLYIYSIGLFHDPWTYRFFPTELAFFLTGALVYKIYFKLKGKQLNKTVINFVWAIIIGFIMTYEYIPGSIVKQWLLYFVFSCAVPFIFIQTKNHKMDSNLGELSYPVYITHLLVVSIVGLIGLPQGIVGLVTALITIGLSVMIVAYLMNPIEKYRQNKVYARLRENDENEKLVI